MSTISIRLSDDRIVELSELAATMSLTVEELVSLSVEALLAQPEAEFQQLVDYTINKNRELYQRLAN